MNDKNVRIVRIINSPIEMVWDAWTNPESMKQWFSPEGMINPEVSNQFFVGGDYRVVMEGRNMPDPVHNGLMVVGGEYLEIVENSRLVFTWLWEGAPAETHTTKVSVLFKKISEEQTEMTLVHSDFADENMLNEHNMGWESTFKKLGDFLEGGENK